MFFSVLSIQKFDIKNNENKCLDEGLCRINNRSVALIYSALRGARLYFIANMQKVFSALRAWFFKAEIMFF